MFGLIFFIGNLIEPYPLDSNGSYSLDYILDCIYCSIVTFMTLGYGVFRPANDLGKIAASSEAFNETFMIALFVLVLGRKMLR